MHWCWSCTTHSTHQWRTKTDYFCQQIHHSMMLIWNWIYPSIWPGSWPVMPGWISSQYASYTMHIFSLPSDLPMCYSVMPSCKWLHCASWMDPSITIIHFTSIPVPTVVPYKSRNCVIMHQHNLHPNLSQWWHQLLPKSHVMKRVWVTTNPLPHYPWLRNVSSPWQPRIATALPRVPWNTSWPRNWNKVPLPSIKRNDKPAAICRRKNKRPKLPHWHQNDAKSWIGNCRKSYKVPYMPWNAQATKVVALLPFHVVVANKKLYMSMQNITLSIKLSVSWRIYWFES